MGKKTFATAQIKNPDSGQWETQSRELTTDDLVMYARLQDLLHGLQFQAVNLFLSQSSTEDRKTLLDGITGYAKGFHRIGGAPLSAESTLNQGDGDDCPPPLTLCWDGSCRLVCPPPPNGDN